MDKRGRRGFEAAEINQRIKEVEHNSKKDVRVIFYFWPIWEAMSLKVRS